MSPTLEQQVRQQIDATIEAAGWLIEDRAEMNLWAGAGVAMREFRMASGYGFADYLLFVVSQAVGALEAKAAGYPLSSVELQAEKCATGADCAAQSSPSIRSLHLLSNGVETCFINGLDPEPRSRAITANFPEIHRPETLAEWIGLRNSTYRSIPAAGVLNQPSLLRTRGGSTRRPNPGSQTSRQQQNPREAAVSAPSNRLSLRRRLPTEIVHANGQAVGGSLLDFWQWSASDLVSNATRGRFAEYLVHCAVGGSADSVRDEWDAFDLTTPQGTTVEVKSAAYVQTWHQAGRSKIVFRTPKTRAWSADTNELAPEARRQASVYVFALLHHTDKSSVDPLNVRQWTFYILATTVLDARTRSQHSITLLSLEQLCGHGGLAYEEIAAEIERVAHAV